MLLLGSENWEQTPGLLFDAKRKFYLHNLANKANKGANQAAVPKARSGNCTHSAALLASLTLELVGPECVCPSGIICIGQLRPFSTWIVAGPG